MSKNRALLREKSELEASLKKNQLYFEKMKETHEVEVRELVFNAQTKESERYLGHIERLETRIAQLEDSTKKVYEVLEEEHQASKIIR